MNVSTNDVAIIEQALKAAVLNSTDYEEIEQFESVLKKLNKETNSIQNDGFRYDYDDNSL
jgi:predicted transcriptional regulator